MIRDKGFTLIELMIVVVIVGMLAAMAGPSISDYIDKRKIISAAEAVYSQLQFARSQAISRSQTVYVNFGYTDDTKASTWLMSVSTNDGCDITKTVTATDLSDDCILLVSDGDANVDEGDGTVDTDDLVYHVTSGADFNEVKLDADGSGTGGAPGQISFDPTRGTALNRTVYLTFTKGSSDYEMRIVVGQIGRVKVCTPTGVGKAVPGYSACPV